MNIDPWKALGITVLGLFVVRLLLSPYWLHRDKVNELTKSKEDSKNIVTANDSAIMKLRREIRHLQESRVSDIPVTLRKMRDVVRDLELEKEKHHYSKDKLLSVLLEALDMGKDDPLLTAKHFKDKAAIGRTTNDLKHRMGVGKKRDRNKGLHWGYRLALAMDNAKIGLNLELCEEFQSLKRELEKQSTFISGSRIGDCQRRFVDDVFTLYSVKLLMAYGKVKTQLSTFPKEIKDSLIALDHSIDAQVSADLTQVNHWLEKHELGEKIE